MRIKIFTIIQPSAILLLVFILLITISSYEVWAQDEADYPAITMEEFVDKKLRFKTRKYITSGGMQYMPNGKNGSHSPFMSDFIEALRSYGGRDNVLTISEIHGYLLNSITVPHAGEFANNETGSDMALTYGGYDGGKIYALIIGNSSYEEWRDLRDPVIDADAVAKELKNEYQAEVEVLKNVSKAELILKIREYAIKSFSERDQLIIIYAGHGEFDELFEEGYLMMKDSKKEDHGKISQISHSMLKTIVNSIPSLHTLLILDASFGHTWDALDMSK